MSDLLVVFRVKAATDLPKTDTFSAIDPFVRVTTSLGQVVETRVVKDEACPSWEEHFVLRLPAGSIPGAIGGGVELELFDEDSFRNQKVGSCTVEFEEFQDLSQMRDIPRRIELKSKYVKQGKDPWLYVSVEGAVKSYPALRSSLSGIPGAIFADHKQRIYLPQEGGRFYLGVEYEKDAVDFKLFTTSPGTDLYLDMLHAGRRETKVRRRMYPSGERIADGLVAYQEIKLDDVPVWSDFRGVSVLCFDSRESARASCGAIVAAHGWRGSLDFDAAKATLRGIAADDDKREIWMTAVDGEAMLVVDWDDGNVDMKLAVIPSEASQSKGYDLTIRGEGIKKSSQLFTPPRRACGRFDVGRVFELDDVPYGTALDRMEVFQYSLTNGRQYTVQEMTGIMPA